MSTAWSLFVIIGTLGSIAGTLWLLFANRKASPQQTTGHNYDGIEEYENPLPRWWIGMFVATIVFGCAYLVYYPGLGNFAGVGGWTSQQQVARDMAEKEARFAPLYARLAAMTPEQLAQDQQAQQIGRRLFLNNCQVCHGINAQGGFGFPNLTDNDWQWGGSFDDIVATISHGRTAAMVPWEAALGGDAGVNDMAQYVLSLSGHATDAAAAARAAPKFQLFCIACHGPEGKGTPALGAPNLTDDTWLYGGDADTIAFTIRNGRSGQMPAFIDVLGPDKIHILAGYVKELSAQ
jgi:cytochrome c oxidase cbb3-type subunit III